MLLNRTPVLTCIASILVIALVLSGGCFISEAQTEISFGPTDKFAIPEKNSAINFATNRPNSTIAGTYAQANLENSAWHFVNITLSNSPRHDELTLIVSAQDCDVTIRSYQITNTTTLGGVRLRYYITGRGTQSFNFGFVPKGGEWDISFNGKAKAPNNGWSVSPDATLTITGATANVSITYYGLPADFGVIAAQPVYQQHSVAIITAVAVLITVALTVVIRIKTKNTEPKE
jgi:hypothetical protein